MPSITAKISSTGLSFIPDGKLLLLSWSRLPPTNYWTKPSLMTTLEPITAKGNDIVMTFKNINLKISPPILAKIKDFPFPIPQPQPLGKRKVEWLLG